MRLDRRSKSKRFAILEEQIGLVAAERRVANLINDKKFWHHDGAVHGFAETPVPLRLGGEIAERDRQVRLSRPRWSKQHNVLTSLDKAERRELLRRRILLSDFLEEVLRAELPAKRASPTIKTWTTSILASRPVRQKPKTMAALWAIGLYRSIQPQLSAEFTDAVMLQIIHAALPNEFLIERQRMLIPDDRLVHSRHVHLANRSAAIGTRQWVQFAAFDL